MSGGAKSSKRERRGGGGTVSHKDARPWPSNGVDSRIPVYEADQGPSEHEKNYLHVAVGARQDAFRICYFVFPPFHHALLLTMRLFKQLDMPRPPTAELCGPLVCFTSLIGSFPSCCSLSPPPDVPNWIYRRWRCADFRGAGGITACADVNRMNTRHTRGNAKGNIVDDPWLTSTTASKANGNGKRPLCEFVWPTAVSPSLVWICAAVSALWFSTAVIARGVLFGFGGCCKYHNIGWVGAKCAVCTSKCRRHFSLPSFRNLNIFPLLPAC